MYSSPILNMVICQEIEDLPVRSGLAMTPAEMNQAALQGRAISTSNESFFFDGTENPTWDVPLMSQRGIDIATAWETAQSAKKKIGKAVQSVKQSKSVTDGIS